MNTNEIQAFINAVRSAIGADALMDVLGAVANEIWAHLGGNAFRRELTIEFRGEMWQVQLWMTQRGLLHKRRHVHIYNMTSLQHYGYIFEGEECHGTYEGAIFEALRRGPNGEKAER